MVFVEITPYPDQIAHTERLVKIFERQQDVKIPIKVAGDYSPPGAGKTITTFMTADKLNVTGVLVFGLVSMEDMWRETGEFCGARVIDSMSLERLRGTSTGGCNNPYLTRDGHDFTPTEYLKNL